MKIVVSPNTVLVSSLIIFGCTSFVKSNPTSCLDDSATTTDTSTDLFPHKVIPTVSTEWDVTYYDTYKILYNKALNGTYLLYQCGTPIPNNDIVNNIQFNTTPIAIPITKVSISEANTITFLEQLGQLRSVVAYTNDVSYISSSCLLQSIQDSTTFVVTNETELASLVGTSQVANDILVANDTTIVSFASPYDTSYPFRTNNQTIVTSTQNEITNGGIFEWIKFYSTLYNLEELANTIFTASQDKSTCVKNSAIVSTSDTPKPTVLWAYYSPFCQGWDVGKCPNYYCEFASDCSATILSTDYESGSIDSEICGAKYFNLTELVLFGKDADVWIFPSSDWETTFNEFGLRLQLMKSIQNKQVYDIMGSGINAWFEERYGEYYDVTQDFCSVVNTTTGLIGRTGWFRNVFTTKLPIDDTTTVTSGIDGVADSSTLAEQCLARNNTLLFSQIDNTICDVSTTVLPPPSSSTSSNTTTTTGTKNTTSETTTGTSAAASTTPAMVVSVAILVLSMFIM